ncbi:MAG: PRC-barrel domain containing protein [Alphaproteobacteria bacterium]|nr:MAG: PRC-barrel domain containing protein [Alphaproteobacteria bacterium]
MEQVENPIFLTARTINGDKVINMVGEHLGKIEDLMIDLESGRVAYAVLSFGGFLGLGNKLFAVPWEALSVRPHEHAFALDVSKEILEKAEGFDKDDWPLTCEQLATSTREWLANIYTCYGYKPYWEKGVLEQTEKERLGETESESMARIEKKAEPKKEEVEEAHVEPIHPSENRGGKKRGLLDTCK